MADTQMVTKRLAITNSNAQMVIVVAVASFVVIFCLVASKAVWSQNQYQARVTAKKETATKQLKANIRAYDTLAESYQAFVSKPNNVIGGSSNGTGDKDGDNAKIILDALPSTYDFPALTSSLEKILTTSGLKITSITGTDDQVGQQGNSLSNNPKAVSMPFAFTVSDTNYNAVSQLITTLQQSIRPIQIDSINLNGGASNMTLTITAHTYYQPGKSLDITKEVVK